MARIYEGNLIRDVKELQRKLESPNNGMQHPYQFSPHGKMAVLAATLLIGAALSGCTTPLEDSGTPIPQTETTSRPLPYCDQSLGDPAAIKNISELEKMRSAAAANKCRVNLDRDADRLFDGPSLLLDKDSNRDLIYSLTSNLNGENLLGREYSLPEKNLTAIEILGEKQIGTDPTKVDTDGDGFGDGAEVQSRASFYRDVLSGNTFDPLHADAVLNYIPTYLRLSNGEYTHYKITDDALAHVKSKFANASIANPDGKLGINLHIIKQRPVLIPEIDNSYNSTWSLAKEDVFALLHRSLEEPILGPTGLVLAGYKNMQDPPSVPFIGGNVTVDCEGSVTNLGPHPGFFSPTWYFKYYVQSAEEAKRKWDNGTADILMKGFAQTIGASAVRSGVEESKIPDFTADEWKNIHSALGQARLFGGKPLVDLDAAPSPKPIPCDDPKFEFKK